MLKYGSKSDKKRAQTEIQRAAFGTKKRRVHEDDDDDEDEEDEEDDEAEEDDEEDEGDESEAEI
jgi:hypothetical protein